MTEPGWVQQEDAWGCTVACLAMLLGRSYAEMRAELLAEHPARDFTAKGLNYLDADQILTAHGFATARIFRFYVDAPRVPWPPEPFGRVHLCEVICGANSPGGHSVLLLADGSVLDPLTRERRRLTDYAQVYNVAAVVPFERLG